MPFALMPFLTGAFLNVVHLYHCLFFKLTPSDIFHHGLFVGGVGIPAQLFRWGSMRSFMSFFASGLPGGIDCALPHPRNSPAQFRAQFRATLSRAPLLPATQTRCSRSSSRGGWRR